MNVLRQAQDERYDVDSVSGDKENVNSVRGELVEP
jgi:hypothetical protein